MFPILGRQDRGMRLELPASGLLLHMPRPPNSKFPHWWPGAKTRVTSQSTDDSQSWFGSSSGHSITLNCPSGSRVSTGA
jgi:hypothetical protein